MLALLLDAAAATEGIDSSNLTPTAALCLAVVVLARLLEIGASRLWERHAKPAPEPEARDAKEAAERIERAVAEVGRSIDHLNTTLSNLHDRFGGHHASMGQKLEGITDSLHRLEVRIVEEGRGERR